jgi:hypothetical protein
MPAAALEPPASNQTAPDGSNMLRLDAASVQTARDGSRPIVWMIKGIRQNIGWQTKRLG